MGFSEDFIKDIVDDDDVPLPGFRFHPTDEELVSFYLRRKLDKKPISIELIKQIDIYKHDPWDLPKASGTGGEKEGYFFCKRGRKYRNSIRPNRVTGSGFWKATGIDKPIYSHGGEGNDCIGLKKTLVYYRGNAGKGTKTDWMMHEFRLPGSSNSVAANTDVANSKNDVDIVQEAEIWTLCRIFKRNASQRKQTPDLRQLSGNKRHHMTHDHHSKSTRINVESNNDTHQESYISFGATLNIDHHHHYQNEHKPVINNYTCSINDQRSYYSNQLHHVGHELMNSQVVAQQPQLMSAAPSSNNLWINHASSTDFFGFENWDELGSVVKFAVDSPSL